MKAIRVCSANFDLHQKSRGYCVRNLYVAENFGFRLRVHGKIFERFHFCFYAKTVANAVNLPQKLEIIEYSDNIFPSTVGTRSQNDKRYKNDF